MLDRLWETYHCHLLRLAGTILRDPEQRKDALQECLIRLLKCGRTFQSEEEAYRFARRTLINICLDFLRRGRYRARRLGLLEAEVRHGLRFVLEDPLTHLLRQEEKSRRKTLMEAVQQIVEELPTDQRSAIEIVFRRRDKKLKEVCMESGIPYSTLRSRLLKGIDQIRLRLRRQGYLQEEKDE